MPAWAKPGSPATAPVAPPVPLAWVRPSAGGTPELGSLPADRTEAIFTRFCQIVRKGLPAATVIDWSDPEAIADPATEGPPWLRLTPLPGNPEPICVDVDGLVCRCPLQISVETSVTGADPRLSMTLWRALQTCLFPLDAELEELGVSALFVRTMPWGTPVEAKTQTRCEGRGVFELTVYYSTPT